MDRRTFTILCHLLRIVSGLSSTEIVDVEEMVEMFLHVLAHDMKNRKLIKRPVPITNNYNDQRWKCFENCLGALDGTYIKVNVPEQIDLHSERVRGKLPQTYWAYATQKGISFMSSPIGKDPRQTRGFYVMPLHEKMDYKYQRDIIICLMRVIQTRRNFSARTEASGTTCKSGVDCWAILRGKSYYSLQIQCCTMLACCLLHNLINREMTYFDDVDEGNSAYVTTIATEDIHYIKTTNEWSQWRDELAKSKFTYWQLHNA
ncbi:retrotransposon protein [Cucumis melo var. makuwa]|uniref:Retrotransposon protein n=1 Tax=Cucumis melo var. makuwa TaxID=1194695 RepID=A0A5D3D814_CUCMM|nr:retrotransposon protein [Cucumis melo var. makuwa]